MRNHALFLVEPNQSPSNYFHLPGTEATTEAIDKLGKKYGIQLTGVTTDNPIVALEMIKYYDVLAINGNDSKLFKRIWQIE
jgi:hypothetical protein